MATLNPSSSTDPSATGAGSGKSDQAKNSRLGIAAAVTAALAASVCCLGPLVLVTLGASGAWIGSLSAMEPFRPALIGLSFVALGYGFWSVYRKPKAEVCGPDGTCTIERAPKLNKIGLWLATFAIGALLITPDLVGAAAATPDDDAEPCCAVDGAHPNKPSGRVAAGSATLTSPVLAPPGLAVTAHEERAVLAISGMTCAGCSATLKTALLRVDGVRQAVVTLAPPRAVVSFDSGKTNVSALLAATAAVGYVSRVATGSGS